MHVLRNLALLVSLCQIAESVCPHGWIQQEDRCYHFSHDLEPWTGAMAMCKLMGGALAEVETIEESQYIGRMATNLNKNMWIGLSDVQEEGVWVWMTSLTTITNTMFSNWAPNQPNSDGGEANCATINAFQDSGGIGWWFDWHCSDPLSYICEKGDGSSNVDKDGDDHNIFGKRGTISLG